MNFTMVNLKKNNNKDYREKLPNNINNLNNLNKLLTIYQPPHLQTNA